VLDRLVKTIQGSHRVIDFSAADKRVENELNKKILMWRMKTMIRNMMIE
jgi:hypothetical protein